MRLVILLAAFTIGLCDAGVSLAKVVPMPTLEKNMLLDACRHQGFAPLDFETSYGCATNTVTITCEEAGCQAVVGDLQPVRGNSLAAMLKLMQEDLPARIYPFNARMQADGEDRAGKTVRSVANGQKVQQEAPGYVPEGLQLPQGIRGRVGAGAIQSAPAYSSLGLVGSPLAAGY